MTNDSTGSINHPGEVIPVGSDTLDRIRRPHLGPKQVSVDTVLRLVFWAVPIIFTAATLLFTVRSIDERQADHEKHLRKLEGKSYELTAEQRVLKQQVGGIEKKQDKLIEKVDKVDDKLDDQSSSLAAIKIKLKVPDSLGVD